MAAPLKRPDTTPIDPRRQQLHYLADQVALAVYHRRPTREIYALLAQMRAIVGEGR